MAASRLPRDRNHPHPGRQIMSKLKKNHPAENITVTAWDDSSNILYFESKRLKERFIGAVGVTSPVVGTDNQFVERLSVSLSANLPAGSIIHWGILADPDIDAIVEGYLSGKAGAGGILASMAREHAEYIASGTTQPLIPTNGVRVHKKRLFVGIKVPVTAADVAADDLAPATEHVTGLFDRLKTAGFHFRLLDEAGYRRIVKKVHNPWASDDDCVAPLDEERPLNEQILPNSFSVDYSQDHASISFNDGQHFAKVLSVNNFPQRAHSWIMNEVIGDAKGLTNQIQEPFYLSFVMLYPDQQALKRKVGLMSTVINNQAYGPTIKLWPVIGYKKKRIDTLVHALNGRGEIGVQVSMALVIYSKSKDRLRSYSESLCTYYRAIGGKGKKFDIREDKRILRTVFEQALPLNGSEGGLHRSFRLRSMSVPQAVRFLPIYGDGTGSRTSSGTLVLTRRGEAAMIDPLATPGNANGLVYAESGSGKSFWVQAVVSDMLASGVKVWIIDDGRSYEKLGRSLGPDKCQVITFSKESFLSLNPFTSIPLGGLQEEMSLLSTIFTKMAAPNDGLDDVKRPILERAITAAYMNNTNEAIPEDVANFLLTQPDELSRTIGKQLYPFASGQFAHWFNKPFNINMDAQLIILEMGDLKLLPHLRDVVVLQMFAAIARSRQKLKTQGIRNLLLVEEAKQWLLNPIMAEGIDESYARARKDLGAIACVTQGLLDIGKSPRGDSILQNTAWHAILKQKPDQVQKALNQDHFSIDAYGAEQINSIHKVDNVYSEFMFKVDSAYEIYRLVRSRYSNVMFSTSGRERTEILRMIDQGVSADAAIRRFLDEEARGVVSRHEPTLTMG